MHSVWRQFRRTSVVRLPAGPAVARDVSSGWRETRQMRDERRDWVRTLQVLDQGCLFWWERWRKQARIWVSPGFPTLFLVSPRCHPSVPRGVSQYLPRCLTVRPSVVRSSLIWDGLVGGAPPDLSNAYGLPPGMAVAGGNLPPSSWWP